jgi:hypothetical protein
LNVATNLRIFSETCKQKHPSHANFENFETIIANFETRRSGFLHLLLIDFILISLDFEVADRPSFDDLLSRLAHPGR